jgi:tRNA nucleotidyltransferase (CCA-adding enzyme)
MASLGLLQYIHPGLKMTPELRKLFLESGEIVSWFDLLYLKKPYERWAVYFLALCHPLGAQEFMDICIRLAVNGNYRKKLSQSREQGRVVLDELSKRVARGRQILPSELYHWLKSLPVEVLIHMMAMTTKDEVRRNISLYFTRLCNVRIAITGNDLSRLGIPRGPIYREILDKLLDARLDGKVETKEDELEMVRKLSVKATSQPSV